MSKKVLSLCCSFLIVILIIVLYFVYYKKVDCELEPWKVGDCITSSSSCGDGLIVSTRKIKTQSKNGGKSCGILTKTDNCYIECPPTQSTPLTDTQKAIKVYTLTYDMFPNIVIYVATSTTKCGYLIVGLPGYSITGVNSNTVYIIDNSTIQYIGNIRAAGLYYKIRFVGGENDGKYLTIDSSTFRPLPTDSKSIRVNSILVQTDTGFFWKAIQVATPEKDQNAIKLLKNF